MSVESNRSAKFANDAEKAGPVVVPLVEGVDFLSRDNPSQLLQVIQECLQERSLASSDVLLTGYDAEHDRAAEQVRESTWAMPLDWAKIEAEDPYGMHPPLYAGLSGEPTIAVYDPEQLRRRRPEERDEYIALAGQTLESAKLVEFPIVLSDRAE